MSADSYMNDIEADAVVVDRPRPGVARLRIASTPLGVLRIGVKRALMRALADLEQDTRIRALVLTGTGRAFSVGSDIRDFSRDPGALLHAEQVEVALNQAVADSRLPVIAALNGHTLGGGLVLALACDLRICADTATLGLPEVKVGAFASGGGCQRLPRLIGPGRALDLLLTGRSVDAAEAQAIGLVGEVVATDALAERAADLAFTLAELPADAVAATKSCVRAGLDRGEAAGLALESRLLVEVGLGADAAEGQRAFVEKRAPRFNRPSADDGDDA